MGFKKLLSTLVLALPLVFGLTVKREAAFNQNCEFLRAIRDDLVKHLFENECGDAAHGVLRLVFHDSIGIDPKLGGGGADGSIFTFNTTELAFPSNDGLDDVLAIVGPFYEKWKDQLSPGDFIQFAAALSLVHCPGAPQVKFWFGRPPPKAASPPNLIPNPFDSVTSILARFASVGFSPQEVVALLASHSVAGADTVDPTLAGVPFDTTPGAFDSQFYIETLLKGFNVPGTSGNQGEVETAVKGTLRLQSDNALARDSRTACFWQDLANNQVQIQKQFGAALLKLSFLGQNQSALTDCSDIIPATAVALNTTASFPPGQTIKDIQQSCTTAKFPNLPTLPGPPLVVPPIPQDGGSS